MNHLVALVTADFPYATEILCLFMAIQGSMAVRKGANSKKSMNWFHAFLKSTLTAYSGAAFTNMFMGRPTAMFSNDIFFGACILGFVIVNYLPMDIGYHFFNTFVGEALYTVFSQVFRMGGVTGFSDAAYAAFKDTPSVWYPMPIFGPILFPVALGNMGGFFMNGFDAYLEKGMPWLFQQAFACATFYHFYAHDLEGCIGETVRGVIKPLGISLMTLMGADEKEREDDVLFAKVIVGIFMLFMAIVRMPQFLGPSYSPFTAVGTMMNSKKSKKVNVAPKPSKKNKAKKQ
ncbi:hypothetical protein ACHAWT_008304 [Skeletonema menzelii]|eukprot:scaffold21998_cov147-Skeletonema_menzelii.AAC.4